jgi:sulfate permease
MGASGTAPAFSAALGARLIKKSIVPILFGAFVLLGAFLAGSKVSATIGKEILPQKHLTLAVTTIILLAVSLSLAFANWLRIPQSTSQATVFAVAACAVFFKHFETKKLFLQIIPTWFILPIISFGLMYFAGKFLFNSGSENGVKGGNMPVIKFFVLVASCYVAFSIGANNVGNIVGPLASMFVNVNLTDGPEFIFPTIVTILVFVISPYFGMGSAFMGSKVAKSTGRKIMQLNPEEAVTISFVTASLLLLASVTEGIPSSLVQLNTGAIFGLAVSRYGWRKIFFDNHTRMIWIIWFIAPLISFILAGGFLIIAFKTGWL